MQTCGCGNAAKYRCPHCNSSICSIKCYQSHNNARCFNTFGKNQIDDMLLHTASETSINNFSQMLHQHYHEDEDIDLDAFNIEQLEGLLSKEQLDYFHDHINEFCDDYVTQFTPWYLTSTSNIVYDNIELPLQLNNVSIAVSKCIVECILSFITLTRLYISNDLFDTFDSEIDIIHQDLNPSLYKTQPNQHDPLEHVSLWLQTNNLVGDVKALLDMITTDFESIKHKERIILSIIAKLHHFHEDSKPIQKKLAFYFTYIKQHFNTNNFLIID
ncbi:HIT-type domain-containing protein [Entamoeba marina]